VDKDISLFHSGYSFLLVCSELVDYETFFTLSRQSADQSEDAEYNKIDGNDVIQ